MKSYHFTFNLQPDGDTAILGIDVEAAVRLALRTKNRKDPSKYPPVFQAIEHEDKNILIVNDFLGNISIVIHGEDYERFLLDIAKLLELGVVKNRHEAVATIITSFVLENDE